MSVNGAAMRFPYANPVEIESGFALPAATILQDLEPYLTPERKARIDEVLRGRTFDVATVCEGLYDRGNISAVLRSAEAFGFAPVHVIENGERFKEANRVSKGADKWLEVRKWKTTAECVTHLKEQGYQICVTALDAAKPLQEIDFSRPSAFVLGNEKDGVTQEMKDLADHRVIIPMRGFVQSFNISVAAAIGLYHIFEQRQRGGISGSLSEEEREILRAQYYLRTLDSAPDKLREIQKRKRFD
jgi:tRNA (guanosine-2'-O-)-methyltransferase